MRGVQLLAVCVLLVAAVCGAAGTRVGARATGRIAPNARNYAKESRADVYHAKRAGHTGDTKVCEADTSAAAEAAAEEEYDDGLPHDDQKDPSADADLKAAATPSDSDDTPPTGDTGDRGGSADDEARARMMKDSLVVASRLHDEQEKKCLACKKVTKSMLALYMANRQVSEADCQKGDFKASTFSVCQDMLTTQRDELEPLLKAGKMPTKVCHALGYCGTKQGYVYHCTFEDGRTVCKIERAAPEDVAGDDGDGAGDDEDEYDETVGGKTYRCVRQCDHVVCVEKAVRKEEIEPEPEVETDDGCAADGTCPPPPDKHVEPEGLGDVQKGKSKEKKDAVTPVYALGGSKRKARMWSGAVQPTREGADAVGDSCMADAPDAQVTRAQMRAIEANEFADADDKAPARHAPGGGTPDEGVAPAAAAAEKEGEAAAEGAPAYVPSGLDASVPGGMCTPGLSERPMHKGPLYDFCDHVTYAVWVNGTQAADLDAEARKAWQGALGTMGRMGEKCLRAYKMLVCADYLKVCVSELPAKKPVGYKPCRPLCDDYAHYCMDTPTSGGSSSEFCEAASYDVSPRCTASTSCGLPLGCGEPIPADLHGEMDWEPDMSGLGGLPDTQAQDIEKRMREIAISG